MKFTHQALAVICSDVADFPFQVVNRMVYSPEKIPPVIHPNPKYPDDDGSRLVVAVLSDIITYPKPWELRGRSPSLAIQSQGQGTGQHLSSEYFSLDLSVLLDEVIDYNLASFTNHSLVPSEGGVPLTKEHAFSLPTLISVPLMKESTSDTPPPDLESPERVPNHHDSLLPLKPTPTKEQIILHLDMHTGKDFQTAIIPCSLQKTTKKQGELP